MAWLISDSFVVLGILSGWVALRFMPLWLFQWRAMPERRWLAHFMVVFHAALAYEHIWFWLGRLDRGPRTDFWSTHWSVLLMQSAMVWACLGWMIVLDANRKRWPLLAVPAAAAFLAAHSLPP